MLDAERIHARWQWSCRVKRAQKLQTLNATLRLVHHLEHNSALPSHEELLQHLHAERMAHNLSLDVLDEDVAPGWRSSYIFRERFNLSGQNVDLLVDGAPDAPVAPAGLGGPFAIAWRNYIKAVFKKGWMYKVSCKPSVILYIAENKTLGGREDRNYEGEAMGRKIAVVFFEDVPGGGGLVRRTYRETQAMQQHLLSIAEILQSLQIPIPADPDRTAANTELLLESRYQNLEILRFVCTIEPVAPEPHMFHLSDENNAEAALALEVRQEDRTKMILAKCLERHGDLLAGETLQVAWNLSLPALRDRTAHRFPAPVARRGRAKARGKERGRRRG